MDYSIKKRYKCKLNIQLRVFIKLTRLQNSFTQFDGCGISTVVVNDLEFIKYLQIETLSVLVLEFRGIFLCMRFSSGVLERKIHQRNTQENEDSSNKIITWPTRELVIDQ